jgi:hypothetical protein
MGTEDEARDEQGRWTSGGGAGSGGNKVSVDGLRALAGKPKLPMQREASGMQPSQINKELDQLSVIAAKIADKFIAAGRRNETSRETYGKSDPLAKEFIAVRDRQATLHDEIARRYGPGAPSRLPKGFGPLRG